MSTLKINTLSNGGSAIDFPNSFNVGGKAIEQGYTSSGTEPSSPAIGDIWWDSTNEKLYQYLNSEFKEITTIAGLVWYGDRGVFFGGTTSVTINTIQYVSIPTTSNATDFGDLTYTAGWGIGAVSNSTYGVCHVYNSSYSSYKGLDYVTIATTGNAQTFGNLTTAEDRGATASNGTIGLFSSNAVMDQITIDTTGNATASAASLSVSRDDHAGCANSNRAVFAGAYSASSIIDYVTWGSLGSGTDFGDLTLARGMMAALSNDTYGVFGGGTTGSANNTIDYISIDTAGNATDFGDLSVALYRLGASSNGTRGIFGGGNSGSVNNTIDYITISSPSNATDFGDLLAATEKLSATSGAA